MSSHAGRSLLHREQQHEVEDEEQDDDEFEAAAAVFYNIMAKEDSPPYGQEKTEK